MHTQVPTVSQTETASLPSDLLMFVAAFLSVRDLDAVCGVCHTGRDVLHTVEHWRSLCCGAHPLAKWYPGTTIQTWQGTTTFSKSCPHVLRVNHLDLFGFIPLLHALKWSIVRTSKDFFARLSKEAWWDSGDVLGFGMFRDWRHPQASGFYTRNGCFVERFCISPSTRSSEEAPFHPKVKIGAGKRIAINLGAAPFAFDLTTLRGPGENEPEYQWEYLVPSGGSNPSSDH